MVRSKRKLVGVKVNPSEPPESGPHDSSGFKRGAPPLGDANPCGCGVLQSPARRSTAGVFAIHNYPQAGEFPRHLNSLHPVKYSGTYYLPLNIAWPASPSSIPPQIGFDLLKNPEDICISMRGASMPWIWTMKWRYVRSNTVRLSSAAIREALRSGQI